MSIMFWFKKKRINVFLCGLDGAGKTSITLTLNGLSPTLFPPKPTIGYNSPKLKSCGVKWVFWDVAGEERFRNLWRSYYANVDCVAFVINAKDERLEETVGLLKNMLNDQQLRHMMFLIENLPRDRCRVMECDAFKGTGLKEGLKWLKKNVKK
ncbi:ADP-ribosylation factor [Entamoeba marina]